MLLSEKATFQNEDRQKYRKFFVKHFDETWPRDQKYEQMTSNYTTDQQLLRNVSVFCRLT